MSDFREQTKLARRYDYCPVKQLGHKCNSFEENDLRPFQVLNDFNRGHEGLPCPALVMH